MRPLLLYFKHLPAKMRVFVACALAVLFWSSLGLAENACEDFYEMAWARAKIVQDSHLNIHSNLFSIVDVLPGLHGGKRYVIETKGAWHDFVKDFTEEGGDLIQDLRLYAAVLGKEAARFFGYEILDNNRVVIPSALEVTNAIKKFNESLPDNDPRHIAVGTYPTAEGFVAAETYRYEFLKNSRIPISLKKRHFFHDISGHALQGFFIPNEITDTLRARLIVLQKFANRIRARALSDSEAIEKHIGTLIDRYSNLANFSLNLETRVRLGRLGSEIFDKSALAKSVTEPHELYQLMQLYNSGYVHLKNDIIPNANTAAGSFSKYSAEYTFLISKLEASLDNFRSAKGDLLSQETFGEFATFINELPAGLRFAAEKDLSVTINRMYEIEEGTRVGKPRWSERVKNFLLRKKQQKQVSPEELIIQRRIEHAEKLIYDLERK
jgi:hypothetical protein